MKITEILTSEALIIADLTGTDKTAVLRQLADHLAAQSRTEPINAEQLVNVLWDRERLGSTAIGDGIAIPHGKLPGLTGVVGAFGRHVQGVDFDSLDGSPTHLFFLLVAPDDSVGQHLKALARVSRLLKDSAFRQRLIQAPDRAELFRLIREEDEKL
ncbi:MAG: PTS sugar transporter subunit IIA [Candidatus Binatia bacterium]